ncbi:DNA polymerase III subunit alpha [Cytophagales bacterium LB-30]|uniref:DNA-directed DNA polymerase n=1 Tax=Shiella aurantiaca TaxID=3058365 RepID=A0ABT8F7P5_9BACT|nr:DNA polymerase III subunit alpha [Shiella aurantiaca]MDN4166418.1 DNA polymerase III subunit alpha [Shiella aurantiaca]
MFWNCHSFFSFKYGVFSIKALIERANFLGINVLGLTDINSTAGCIDFVREATKAGIKPIVGIEFRSGDTLKYIGLAKSNGGFSLLNRHLSEINRGKRHLVSWAPALDDCFILYPFAALTDFRELAENERVAVRLKDLNRLRFSEWRKFPEKLVFWHPVTFSCTKDFHAHRILRAIAHTTLLTKLPDCAVADRNEQFETEEALRQALGEFSFLLSNALTIMEACSISFAFGEAKNKRVFGKDATTDYALLHKITHEGALKRYGLISEAITARIDKELAVIKEKGFVSYFLINWDIIQFAQRRKFFYVGRGSGANSIVAYCLYITNVDPLSLDLYFERFINLYRENPPDFDLDFSWKDRDEVIQHIFDTHGEEHTCLLATYSTFQLKSLVREIGKVFGLPTVEIEELIQNYGKEKPSSEMLRLVYVYAEYLKDVPSHLSIHAGGVLISDKPIYHYTATHLPPKGFPVSYFDMLVAEDVGLYKFDILSQRGLGHIRDTVTLVKENRGEEVDIHRIEEFKQDERIKSLLRRGDTMGCFYVESPAMRMLLSKLQTDTYLGLVAASSIIRPGVASSGMMREYILRHRDEQARKHIHPTMGKIMPETYGVMVYQEDVIKVAHYFAGLTLAEADVLRRGMSGKFRSREEFQKIKERFFQNCEEKGYEDDLVKEIWFQIESFAGYSFSKGHSASYAVESYQSLYLKAYYPLEFMVGVINNFGGFYQTEFYVHEARRCGAQIEAPCINLSKYLTSIQGHCIYLGFIHIAHLEQKTSERIAAEQRRGVFRSLADFLERVHIGLEQLVLLIRVGAFRSLGISRKRLLWEAHFLINNRPKNTGSGFLFDAATYTIPYEVPPLIEDEKEEWADQIELLGFPLVSPFKLLHKKNLKGVLAKDLRAYLGKEVQVIGYLVTVKYTRTTKGDMMNFGTFLDQEGEWIDTVHFPDVCKDYPFKGAGCYMLRGKVVEEFNFCTIEVSFMERLNFWTRDS